MMQSRVDRIEAILHSGIQYVVPAYQRTYAWRKDQWEILWRDIIEAADPDLEREHFLGALIIMPVENALGEPQSFLLIDGQQRLITISILLAAIRDAAKLTSNRLAEMTAGRYLVSESFMIQELQPIIRVKSEDRDSYDEVLLGEIRSKSLITDAYKYYLTKVKEYVQDREKVVSLLRSIIREIVMVEVVLSPDQDPLPVFMAMNTRGLYTPPPARPKVSPRNRSKQAAIISKIRSTSSDEEIDLIDTLLSGLGKFRQDPELMALVNAGESELVEFKLGACRDPMTGNNDNKMREKIVRAVAAFMNAPNGGTLLIGVDDNGTIIGINDEYSVANSSKPHWDGYELVLRETLNSNLSIENPFQYYTVTKHIIDGKDVCRIRVTPAPEPVFFKQTLFVRAGNQTLPRQATDLVAYIRKRWPNL